MDGAVPPVLHMPSWYMQGNLAFLVNTRNVSHVTPVKILHIIIGMVSCSFVSQNNMLWYEVGAYKQYICATSSLVSYGHAVDFFQKKTFAGLNSFIFAIHVTYS